MERILWVRGVGVWLSKFCFRGECNGVYLLSVGSGGGSGVGRFVRGIWNCFR